ncbi:MAG: hypothetical protein AAB316_15785, partial [Bacteroidota bacterium]
MNLPNQISNPDIPVEEHDEFRDHLATVDKKGKRIWIYPKKPKGRFYNWRGITSIPYAVAITISLV